MLNQIHLMLNFRHFNKKSCVMPAEHLYNADIIDLFSQEDQRVISFYAGRQESLFGKEKKQLN